VIGVVKTREITVQLKDITVTTGTSIIDVGDGGDSGAFAPKFGKT